MKIITTILLALISLHGMSQDYERATELAAGNQEVATKIAEPWKYAGGSYYEGMTYDQVAASMNNLNKHIGGLPYQYYWEPSDTVDYDDGLMYYIRYERSNRISDVHIMLLTNDTVRVHKYDHYAKDPELERLYDDMIHSIRTANAISQEINDEILDWIHFNN